MQSILKPDIILTVKNLTVKFPNLTALKNISFTLKRGDFFAIIGPNGSGKSVLVKTLLGNIPYEGEILWQPNLTFGYVPQKVDLDRYLSLTLEDFLLFKIKILHLSKKIIKDTIELVGLNPFTL